MNLRANSPQPHFLNSLLPRLQSSLRTCDCWMHGIQQSISRASVIHVSAQRDICWIHSLPLRTLSASSLTVAVGSPTLALVVAFLACRWRHVSFRVTTVFR